MKKRIAVLSALLMILVLGACSGSKPASILGTWIDEYNSMTFLEDGTVLWAERGSANGTFGAPDKIQYSIDGDKLTFKPDNDTYTFKVSGNTLTLSSDGNSIVLTKVDVDASETAKNQDTSRSDSSAPSETSVPADSTAAPASEASQAATPAADAPAESAADTPAETPSESAADAPAPESDDKYVLQMVDITLDNWEEYFEVVAVESPASWFMANMIPDTENFRYFEYEFRLKDSYAESFREHGDYGYPEGKNWFPEVIQLLVATGDGWVNDVETIEVTFTLRTNEAFTKFIGVSSDDMLGNGQTLTAKLAKGAFLRYLIAQDGYFAPEQNECFLHVFTPLRYTNVQVSNSEDLSSYGWTSELSEDFLKENIEITITGISGKLPVWTEK